MDVRSRGTAVATLVVAIVLVASLAGGTAGAGSDDDAAERAARAISAARERANALTDELWAAQSAYDLLGEEARRLEVGIERLERDVDALRATVESVAVARFVASGSEGIPLLTDVRAPNDQARADVLVGVIADVGATTLDDFGAARTELDDARRELEANRRASERQQGRLERLRAEAEAEVERLREVEQQRLEDEAVQRALAAQLAEEQRQRDEAERRAAEAARRAEIDEVAAAAAAGEGGAASPAPGGTTGGSDGGTVGGRTGVTGGGSTPAGGGGGGPFVDAIVCPVVGGSGYGDTWGAPRSGGRRHQGVDMLAPIGTQLVAVVGGTVEHRTNRLGGITITLAGDNGNRYYYAHLHEWEGPPGPVTQGQVIGYVGESGNATGVPHLHFEIRPNGGVPVNPTPSVRAAGC